MKIKTKSPKSTKRKAAPQKSKRMRAGSVVKGGSTSKTIAKIV